MKNLGLSASESRRKEIIYHSILSRERIVDFDLCARLQNWGHENLRNLIKDSTKSPVLVNNANIIECEEILHGDSQQLEENVRENSLNRSIELLRTNPLNRPLEILEERNALEAEPNDTINEFVVTCKSPESLESNDILTVQSEYDMVHILDNYLSNVNSCEVALTQRILSNSCPMESIGILVAFQVTREIFSEKSIIHRFLSFNDEFLRFTVQVLSTVLRDATIVKITYDWKSLFKFIMQYTGMNVAQFYPIKNLFDMKIAAWMLKPDISRKDIELDQICRQNNMVPLQHSKDEIVDDFHRIFKLFEKLNKKLTEENLKDCFSGQEMIFLQILYQMEINAIAIDRNLLENILQECKLRSDAIKNQIFEEAGTSFNIQSPLQVRKILFEVMKIPYPTSTSIMEDKSKQQSTSEEILSLLQDEHKIAEYILAYRQIQKLSSSYIQPFLHYCSSNLINILHCQWNQTGTATGRISSSNPNMQNLPKKSISLHSSSFNVRNIICPVKEKGILVSLDYCQIEIRVLAMISSDSVLQGILLKNEAVDDIYSIMAAKIIGKSLETVTKTERDSAKTVTLALLYGMGTQSLRSKVGKLGVNSKQKNALEFQEFFHKTRDVISQVRKHGFANTLGMRKRYLPAIHSQDFKERMHAERQAINTVIQGSASDIIKQAMIRIQSEISKEGQQDNMRMILQIHDEIVVDIKDACLLDEFISIAQRSIRKVHLISDTPVPFPVLCRIGRRFGDLEQYKTIC